MSEGIQNHPIDPRVQSRAQSLQPKLVGIRRVLHRQPELSNREFRTSKLVAEYLKSLGLQGPNARSPYRGRSGACR